MANNEEDAIMDFFGRDALNNLPILNENNDDDPAVPESYLDIPIHFQEAIDAHVELFAKNDNVVSTELVPTQEDESFEPTENLVRDENGFILLTEREENELLAETPRSK